VTERRAALVLVVDDDRLVRLMACTTLAQAGYRTVEAPDGADALVAFDEHQPDLVILDVMMPRLDGFETCRQLRDRRGGDRTPILMMTGRDDVAAIHRAFEAGATDFINKPIPWAMLSYRVQYMLRAAGAMQALARSEAQLTAAQRVARLGHWEWDLEANQMMVSEMSRSLLCMDGQPNPANLDELVACVHVEDRALMTLALERAAAGQAELDTEVRGCRTKGTETVWLRVQGTVLASESGLPTALSGTVQDITEVKKREAETRYLAYYDALTGLPNRVSMVEALDRAVAGARRHGRLAAVLLLDLDHFKRINETLGHGAGDRLLSQIGARLRNSVRTEDLVGAGSAAPADTALARMGGDEFTILLTDLRSVSEATATAERVLQVVREPLVIDGHEVVITASIGIALYPLDGDNGRGLMAAADVAMYLAKGDGGNTAALSNKPMRVAAGHRLSIEGALRRAIEREQFLLYYQPKLDLSLGRILGVEALLRWRHPELGLVPPMEFIPVAEETGLIEAIGEWAVREACRQLRKWSDEGHHELAVAVNLWARQFRQRALATMIHGALQATGIDAQRLELEITESTIMRDIDLALATLRELRDQGCRVAVDDFGTGYSSLAYVKRFPVNTLKIDRTFVQGLPGESNDEAIVHAIVTMAHGLGLRVVGEGVETAAQLTSLASQGCDEVQGYLLGRPVAPEAIPEIIAAASPLAEIS
jgi:diguanylate cyclase (GGDEF)-like protein